MSDFHQGGVITTLDRPGPNNLDALERDLEKTAALRPVALVLPCLPCELGTGAVPRNLEELQHVRSLAESAVAPGRASGEQFVLAGLPDIFDRLAAAVDRDNA
jgi:glucosyl-3-phosphoglycerate synthase